MINVKLTYLGNHPSCPLWGMYVYGDPRRPRAVKSWRGSGIFCRFVRLDLERGK